MHASPGKCFKFKPSESASEASEATITAQIHGLWTLTRPGKFYGGCGYRT